MERRELNSTVFARFGLKDAVPERNLVLFPYLLGLREGMVVLLQACRRDVGLVIDAVDHTICRTLFVGRSSEASHYLHLMVS